MYTLFEGKRVSLKEYLHAFRGINEALDKCNTIPYKANTDKVVISNGRETMGLNTDRWLTFRVL